CRLPVELELAADIAQAGSAGTGRVERAHRVALHVKGLDLQRLHRAQARDGVAVEVGQLELDRHRAADLVGAARLQRRQEPAEAVTAVVVAVCFAVSTTSLPVPSM